MVRKMCIRDRPLGRFGYSVMKPKTRKRLEGEKRKKYRKRKTLRR